MQTLTQTSIQLLNLLTLLQTKQTLETLENYKEFCYQLDMLPNKKVRFKNKYRVPPEDRWYQ
jgi:hypothetical protein